MEDHCEAYPFWLEQGVRRATCVHVDAHLDVSDDSFSPDSLARILAARCRQDLEGLRGKDLLPWGGFHCGNYLYPALLGGMIEHLIWVVPPHLPQGDILEWARRELQHWLDLDLADYASLTRIEDRVEGTLAGRRFTLCTAEAVPHLEGPLLLDIDLDYFLDPEDKVWQTPYELLDALALQPDIYTIARSVEGGYTPLEHRYLGEITEKACRGQRTPWEGLLRQILQADREGKAHDFRRLSEAIPDPPPWLLAALRYKEGLQHRRERSGHPLLAEAAHLDPGYAPHPADEGALHFRREEMDPARACFRLAFQQASTPQEAGFCLFMLGLVEASDGEYGKAEELWRPLVTSVHLTPPEQGYVAFRLGRVLARLGRTQDALDLFAAGLEREPDRPLYLHHYGLALREAGQLEAAARVFRKVLRLAPDRLGSLELHLALAEIYQAQGKSALAQSEYRRLASKDVTGIYSLKALLGSR
jgi:tetratricopeptide (TPR) repeat protein